MQLSWLMVCRQVIVITINKADDVTVVDVAAIEADAQKLLNHLGYDDFDLGIELTTNEGIRHYNKEFRNKDKPTDILSFPYHLDLAAGEQIIHQSEDDKNLGDIIISVEYVRDKAVQDGQSLEDRLRMLLVHGICHLLGYTHDQDDDYAIMLQKEQELLGILSTT